MWLKITHLKSQPHLLGVNEVTPTQAHTHLIQAMSVWCHWRNHGTHSRHPSTPGRRQQRAGCCGRNEWCWLGFPLQKINDAINSLRLRQNGCQFPDDTFKRIFLTENVMISIKILLKFVPWDPISSTQVSDSHLSPPGALQSRGGIFAMNIVKKSTHAVINKIRPLIVSYVFVSINYMNAYWYWWGWGSVYDFFATIKEIWSQNFSI